MPFCAKCGTQINDGASFCPSCGNALGQNPKQTNTTAPVAQKPKTTKKRSNKGLIFTLVGVCAAAIIAVILFFCLGDSANSEHTTKKRATPEAALQEMADAALSPAQYSLKELTAIFTPKAILDELVDGIEEEELKGIVFYLLGTSRYETLKSATVHVTKTVELDEDDLYKVEKFYKSFDLHVTDACTVYFQSTFEDSNGTNTESDFIDMACIDGEWFYADNELLEEILHEPGFSWS